MKAKSLRNITLVVLSLLCVPLIAMQFTNEVQWSIFDFLIAGVLLFGLGLLLTYLINKIKDPKIKIGIIIGLIVLFLLIWAELAVGIFNSPFAGS